MQKPHLTAEDYRKATSSTEFSDAFILTNSHISAAAFMTTQDYNKSVLYGELWFAIDHVLVNIELRHSDNKLYGCLNNIIRRAAQLGMKPYMPIMWIDVETPDWDSIVFYIKNLRKMIVDQFYDIES